LSQARDPLGLISSPTWTLPNDPRTGIAIGANLSNNNAGPSATGSAIVTAGGVVQGAYLYVGFENNTTGSVSISGAGSKWTNSSAGIIGHFGTGTLDITDGGLYSQVNPDSFAIGYGDTGVGSVMVDGVAAGGDRSSIIVLNNILVGESGKGALSIANGGFVSSSFTTFVGDNAGASGAIVVDGVNAATGLRSTLKVLNNNIQIGETGQGTAFITDGGLISVPAIALLGRFAGGTGILYVDGVNALTGDHSTLVAPNLRVADSGLGELNVTNGGQVNSSSYAYAGKETSGVGIINIDGIGSAVATAGTGWIGYQGNGTLNLSNGGAFNAAAIQLASQNTATGTINVGTGGLSGVLNAPTVQGGAGAATVNFNHAVDIVFASLLTGNLDVNQVNSGTTTLLAGSDYAGLTTVTDGTLAAASANRFSANSDYSIDTRGTLALNGYSQTLLSLKNTGMLRFGGQANTMLTIANNYVGDGGTLALNAVLGGDGSATDKLLIQGNSSGNSTVTVKNIDGLGALTADGIKIIDVTGTSGGKFTLLGDTVFDGAQAVVGGAYAYRLFQGDGSSPADGDWYLRSTLRNLIFAASTGPGNPSLALYQPGVPTYEAYPQFLLGLNSLPTLQQREGNRFWNDASAASSGGDGSGQQTAGSAVTETNGIWGRVEAGHTRIDPKDSTSDSAYNYDTSRIQIGFNAALAESDAGKLVGGVFTHYVHGNAGTIWNQGVGRYGYGKISTDGYGLGAALTWYGDSGFYVDGAAQAMWYSSDLFANPGHDLKNGSNAFGQAFSIEAGKRMAMNESWSVTPQFQLTYSKADFRDFRDIFNAPVSAERDASLQGRLGISLERQVKRIRVYGIANIYDELLDGTSVVVGDKTFVSRNDPLWAGIGLGGSYSWNEGKYSIYGEGAINTSLANIGDSYGYGGTIGFRMQW
jgi:outer membrane autotransporter protein